MKRDKEKSQNAFDEEDERKRRQGRTNLTRRRAQSTIPTIRRQELDTTASETFSDDRKKLLSCIGDSWKPEREEEGESARSSTEKEIGCVKESNSPSFVNKVTAESMSAYLPTQNEVRVVSSDLSRAFQRDEKRRKTKAHLNTFPIKLVTGNWRLMHLTLLSPDADVCKIAAWNDAGIRSSRVPS